jgi:signal transduction histidine kinase
VGSSQSGDCRHTTGHWTRGRNHSTSKKLLKRSNEPLLQEFNLNEAIADALCMLSPEAAKRRITLSANGIQQTLPVRADRIHIQQVVLNLATNAMDAMTGSAPDARAITIQTSLREGAQVEVSVTDSGMGIPEHKLSKVFDTFYTTKKEGTGLGLSITRTIVENYGGQIWAENRIGGGGISLYASATAPGVKGCV